MLKVATKCVAYPLMGLAVLIIWGGQVLIVISAVVAIVGAFIDGGPLIGLISIPLVGFAAAIARFIWSLVTLPLLAVAAGAMALAEDDREA